MSFASFFDFLGAGDMAEGAWPRRGLESWPRCMGTTWRALVRAWESAGAEGSGAAALRRVGTSGVR